MTEAIPPKIMIDGTEYPVESLSEEARTQLINVQLVDKKIMDAQQEVGILQTARASYYAALRAALPNEQQ